MIFFTYDEDNYDSEEVRESVKYEELRKVKGIWIDRRYASSPEDIPYYKGNKEWADKEWYGEGKNHRVTDGMIERDFEEEFSIIELNSLDDLLEFQRKYDTNASISIGSHYFYNGELLNTFNYDYHVE